MQNATDDIVSAIMGRWAAAFSNLDARRARIALLAERVLLRLESESVSRQRRRAAYFEGCRDGSRHQVKFTDIRTAQVAADVINVAGTASFLVEEDAEPLTVKITWVIIREGGEWKIVSHHVSSKTPLIAQ